MDKDMDGAIAVTIIICTYNKALDLQQTLESLSQLQVPRDLPTELIVVDNKSTDNTKQVVEAISLGDIQVRYIYEPRPGKGFAVNTAFANARGDIILMTDEDVRLPSDWIARMTTPLREGKAVAVAGSISMAPHLERSWMKPMHRNWLVDRDLTDSPNPGVMIGANCGFLKSILQQVPGYDVELGPGGLGAAEDVLFSWQIQQAGFTIQSVDSFVEHHFDASRLTRKSLVDRAIREGRCTAYLYYHWLHSRVRYPLAKYLAKCAMLQFWRVVKRRECLAEEGCPEWELQLLHDASYLKKIMQESKRPRNYLKHGLTRKVQSLA